MDSAELEPVTNDSDVKAIGRFVVTGCLGRGAMGTVYRALDPLIERTVAVKVLSVDLPPAERTGFRERFFREAKSAGRLNHPNIVTIYDVGECDGTPYIAMEYLPGLTLRETLDSGIVVPIRSVVEVAMLVARGLEYAHQNGVIHRDVKPANIMLARSGLVKIMDFGIAVASDTGKTQSGAVLGSPRYMAPEQITAGAADARTDIFALGVTLYEILTGKDPFAGQTIAEVMHKILHVDPVPPSTINPDTPARLEQIIMRTLAKNPAARFDSARELGLALGTLRRELRSGGAVSAVRQSAPDDPGMTTQVVDRAVIREGADRVQPTPRSAGASGDRRTLALAAVVLVAVVMGIAMLPDSRSPARVDPEPTRAQTEVAPPLVQADPVPGELPDPAAEPDSEARTADDDSAIHAEAPVSPPSQPVVRHTIEAPVSLTPTPAPAADTRAAVIPARVVLAVLPWGEVRVDGTLRGVTPPLREIDLPPGRHRIEIRNADFAPYVESVTLKSGATHRIDHRFR